MSRRLDFWTNANSFELKNGGCRLTSTSDSILPSRTARRNRITSSQALGIMEKFEITKGQNRIVAASSVTIGC